MKKIEKFIDTLPKLTTVKRIPEKQEERQDQSKTMQNHAKPSKKLLSSKKSNFLKEVNSCTSKTIPKKKNKNTLYGCDVKKQTIVPLKKQENANNNNDNNNNNNDSSNMNSGQRNDDENKKNYTEIVDELINLIKIKESLSEDNKQQQTTETNDLSTVIKDIFDVVMKIKKKFEISDVVSTSSSTSDLHIKQDENLMSKKIDDVINSNFLQCLTTIQKQETDTDENEPETTCKKSSLNDSETILQMIKPDPEEKKQTTDFDKEIHSKPPVCLNEPIEIFSNDVQSQKSICPIIDYIINNNNKNKNSKLFTFES